MRTKKSKLALILSLCAVAAVSGVQVGSPEGNSAPPALYIPQFDSKNQTAKVTDLVFSPDGSELVTASKGRTIRVFDVATGAEKRVLGDWISEGSTGKIYALAIDPSGRYLACGGWFEGDEKSKRSTSPIRIIDYRTGRRIRNLDGHMNCIDSLAFSPDGLFLAAGDAKGAVQFWRTSDWREYLSMGKDQEDAVYGLAFNPDGSRLACASLDNSIFVKSVPDPKDIESAAAILGKPLLLRKDSAHRDGMRRIAWSPDGKVLASGGVDGEVKLWSAKDLSPLGVLKKVDSVLGDLSCITFLDDTTLACGGSYGESHEGGRSYPLFLIDIGTKAEKVYWGHAEMIREIAVSPDGRSLASTGGGETRLWDTGTLTTLHILRGEGTAAAAAVLDPPYEPKTAAPASAALPILRLDPEGHTAVVSDLAFGSGGKELVTVSSDKTIRVRDLATGKETRVLRGWLSDGGQGELNHLAIDPAGRYLACVGNFNGGDTSEAHGINAIRIFDYRTGLILTLLKGHPNAIRSLLFSPDGRFLASGDSKGLVKVWRTGDWVEGPQRAERHLKRVSGLAFSPDGSRLASASDDLSILVSSTLDGSTLHKRASAHGFGIRGLAYSPDGATIATSGDDGELKLWEAEGLRPLETYYNLGKSTFYLKDHLTFLDERTLIFAGSGLKYQDGNPAHPIFLFDIATKAERIYHGHTNTVQKIAVAPDGHTVASTGGNNHETLLWDSRDLTTLQTFIGHGNIMWAVAYDSGKKAVLYGTKNAGGFPHTANQFKKSFSIKNGAVSDRTNQDGGLDGVLLEYKSAKLELQAAKKKSVLTAGDRKIELPNKEESIHAYTYTPDGAHIIIGTSFGLYRLDTATLGMDGRFVGHEGEVWSFCVSEDGKTLISGGADQTIRFWDIDAFDDRPVFRDASWFTEKWKIYVHNVYRNIDIHRPEDVEELYYALLKDTNADAQQLRVLPQKSPLLSLFVGDDDEWIAWTPGGYYDCSLGGAKYAGWHFNRGDDESAEFYALEQYSSVFYRPDVIEKALQRIQMDLPAVNFANRPPRITEFKINGRPVYDEGEITIETDKSEFSIEFSSVGTATLRQPELFYNGRVINQGKFKGPPQVKLAADKQSLTASYSFSVTNKENRYKVYTADERGFKSAARTVRVVYTGKDAAPAFYKLGEKVAVPKKAGTLHVLTVGINRYTKAAMAAAGMENLGYAEKDAADMASLWATQEGRLFDTVETRVLTRQSLGRDVTQADVLDALTALGKKATRETDSILVFLSGHGLRKDDGFFFLTSEADPTSKATLVATSPSWPAIGDKLKSMTRAKEIVVLVDACHSGAINPTELGFTWKDKGVVLITSSKAGQRSYEGGSYVDEWARKSVFENGLFTAAIIEGFTRAAAVEAETADRAPADLSADDVLIVGEVLSYAAERVGKWTQGQQTPWVPAYDPSIEGKVMGVVKELPGL